MRTSSSRHLVPCLAFALAVLAPARAHAALSCEVSFNVNGTKPFGALQWDVNYPTAPGEFLGSYADAECRSPFPVNCDLEQYDDCFVVNDIDPEHLLRQARISLDGFLGTVSTCSFRARSNPAASDFAVTLLDSSDSNGNSLPAIVSPSLSCMPAVTTCGDGFVDSSDGEDCDQGPYVPGSCCSPTCKFEVEGAACGEDAGNTCHKPDTCDGLGSCLTTFDDAEGPANDCAVSAEEIASRQFGAATALAGDYLIVGAPAAQVEGSGSVHVFYKTEDGRYEEQFQSSPIAVPFVSKAGAKFGVSVDADGETIVVGAPLDVVSQSHGSASVFVRSGEVWKLQQKLVDESGQCAGFGTDVAISGNTIIVGAPDDDCAQVFERSGAAWSLAATLVDGFGGRFGQAVDVAGDSILVGAPGAAGVAGCTTTGAAFLYHRSGDTWSEEGRIPDRAGIIRTDACFGMTVAVNGTTGMVGAPYDSSTETEAGAVYVINKMDDKVKITAQLLEFPAPVAGDHFGSSLDMNSDLTIVGAPGVASYLFEQSAGDQPAAVHRAIGNFGKWNGRRVIRRRGSGPTLTKFGFAVAVDFNRAVVGAPGGLDEPEEQGAVYPTDAAAALDLPCGNGVVGTGEDCDDGDTDWTDGEACNASCKVLSCGDPNDSGSVTANDALFVLRAAVGLKACDLRVCDADGNHGIGVTDALFVLRVAVFLPQTLACPSN